MMTFELASRIVFWLYWAPCAICLYRAASFTWRQWKHDVMQRDAAQRKAQRVNACPVRTYYYPTLTIGAIVKWFAQAFLPIFNIWWALKVCFGRLNWLCSLLDRIAQTPIVPAR